MYRKPKPRQASCFIPGTLSQYVPDDHILKRVQAVLDLSWLAEEVKELYSEDNGRPCIEPERAVRLMLAGFFHGVVHDRKLMREAQVNIAYRWFAGYELDEALPDHSSLTRIRQRWGEERFRAIFERTVAQCVQAGLVGGEMVHLDASLIRADVSWRSLVEHHVSKLLAENEPPPQESAGKTKKVSTTDPEASMATTNPGQRLEPSYKQHTAVDDRGQVIVDVQVTTGEASESQQLPQQLARVVQQLGQRPQAVTADRGYASSANYATLEELGVAAIIPPQPEPSPRRGLPLRRFVYDARHDQVRCPMGKHLQRGSRTKGGWFYRARPADCQGCPRRSHCVPASSRARSVCIKDGYPALLRARRCKEQGWPQPMVRAYHRHRWQVEGVHGEAKTQHGLRRAVRRGLSNVRIQAYLTAAAINLKRLALHVARLLLRPGAATHLLRLFQARAHRLIRLRLRSRPRSHSRSWAETLRR
jgi:transposase